MKFIDKDNAAPLYSQLIDIIIEKIENGEYKGNDKVNSERELCQKYDISRSTVRQAIQELTREGYLYSVQGKGTFISPEKFKQNLLNFYSFTEEMKKQGKTPKSKVLDFEIINSDEILSEKMKINKGEKLLKFTRLRLADDIPMMLETTYLSFLKFPYITKEQLEKNALYDILNDIYNIKLTSAEEIFQAVLTNENEAEILNYDYLKPSMMIERITYSKEEIVEYTKSIARGDRFKYSVLLEK